MSDRNPSKVLLLKTVSADGRAFGDFQWPLTVGAEVAAPDWSPSASCGNGLHGFLWGEGDGTLASWAADAKWLVLEADAESVVDLGGKVKVPRCRVVHVGDRISATAFIAAEGAAGRAIVGGTATAGDSGTATAGYRGTATAGDSGTATAGDSGTATAGDSGTATAGYRGTLVIKWYDERAARYRLAIAYVGEAGIEPNVKYRVGALGRFVRAEG